MKRLPLFLIPVILIFLLAEVFTDPQAAPAAAQPAAQPPLQAGNYCVSCHLAEDPRLTAVTAWKGGIGREVNSPCPAASAIHKELFYTERLLVMTDRLGGGGLPEKLQTQLEGYTQTFSRQLEAPIISLEAFVSEAQGARYRLNKVYTALNASVEADKRRLVLNIAIGASLLALASLAWGWMNTRAFKEGGRRRPGGLIAAGLFLLAVAAFFTLPLFRVPEVVTTTTAEQQEAQAVMDEADRAAASADRAQARAWMLAQIGAALAEQDSAQAHKILAEAGEALDEARADEAALWGESLAVQEANLAPSIQLEKARLTAEGLNAARARQWSLPLVAVQWAGVDPEKAAALLLGEQEKLAGEGGLQRDIQLRMVALAWAQVEPSRTATAAAGIADPAIRSWTLRETAVLTSDPSLFAESKEAADQVQDPVQRARLLRELARVSRNEAWFDEALATLEEVPGESLAYALSDFAAASGDPSIADLIREEFPEARTAALLYSGEPQAALEASQSITDPAEKARAQAAIAAALGDGEMALNIGLQPFRDLALRDVIVKTGNVSLTNNISSVYYRVEAFAALGETASALEDAAGLKESFPVVALGGGLAETEPQTALGLVEGMSREADKAALLRMLAVAHPGDAAFFEQALGMALAARVRGDALAPAQASLDLARSLWTLDPAHARSALNQALETARRITVK